MKTPTPETPFSLAFSRDLTPQEVADAIGVDERTVRRWCGREWYPAPHTRRDDGSLRLNLDEVRRWQNRTGVTGQVGRPDSPTDIGFDFWTKLWSDWPHHVNTITPFEQDLLNGSRSLSVDEMREYIELFVHARNAILERMHAAAGWLVRLRDKSEVQDRARAILMDPLEFAVWRIGQMHDAQDGVERDDSQQIVNRREGAT